MNMRTKRRRPLERTPSVESTPKTILQRMLKHAKGELTARQQEAEEDHERRVMELLGTDRLAPRAALVLLQIDAPREMQHIAAGHPFQHKVGSEVIEVQAARPEMLAPLEIEQMECVQPRRIDPGRPELRALRIQLRRAGDANASPIRLWVESPRLCAALARSKCLLRSGESAPWHAAQVKATGCVNAEHLLPTPRLGSPARTLMTTWFLAPWAFQFIEIDAAAAIARDADSLEICFLGDDAALGDEPGPGSIRLNCVVAANVQKMSVALHVEASSEWTLIPVPPEKAIVAVTRVSWFDRAEKWPECRPWLGRRHPAFADAEPVKQYVLRERRDEAGRPNVLLSLVEPAAALGNESLTHLNVEMIAANRKLPRLARGAEWRGDRGLRGCLVEGPSPFVYPAPLERGETHSEIALARLLAGGGDSERTERFHELLERCAALGDCSPKPESLAQIASIKRFTVTHDLQARRPGALLVTLDVDSYAWSAGSLPIFVSMLERYFRLSAPLAHTRMVVHTPEGDLS